MFNRIKLFSRLKNQRGVTLIEILAVVIILGVLSAIAVPSVYGYLEKAKETKFTLGFVNISAAAERVYDLNPSFKNMGTGSDNQKKVAEAIAELLNTTVYSPSGQWYMPKGYEVPSALKTKISLGTGGKVYLTGFHVREDVANRIASELALGRLATPAEVTADPTVKNKNIYWDSGWAGTRDGQNIGHLMILLYEYPED